MLEVSSFLKDPDFFANPYPLYDRWRAEAPVRWEPALDGWCVTSHAAIVALLADPHLSSDRTESFLAGLPHDVRETLCAIPAFADWCRRRSPPE
jgi:cytochrome P450